MVSGVGGLEGVVADALLHQVASTKGIGSSGEGTPRVTAADVLLAVGGGVARWAMVTADASLLEGDGSKGRRGVLERGSGIAYDHRDTLAPPAAVA